MAAIPHSVMNIPSGVPASGVFNSSALPNGVVAVYLQDKLYKISVKQEPEPRIAFAISLLNNLEHDTKTNLQQLIEERRIGALYIENGKIQSLTLAPDQLQMIDENGVNDCVVQMNKTILLIKENLMLRSYTSEEEYRHFAGLIPYHPA